MYFESLEDYLKLLVSILDDRNAMVSIFKTTFGIKFAYSFNMKRMAFILGWHENTLMDRKDAS